MFFGVVLGVAIGYFFKPQLEDAGKQLARVIKENLRKNKKSEN